MHADRVDQPCESRILAQPLALQLTCVLALPALRDLLQRVHRRCGVDEGKHVTFPIHQRENFLHPSSVFYEGVQLLLRSLPTPAAAPAAAAAAAAGLSLARRVPAPAARKPLAGGSVRTTTRQR